MTLLSSSINECSFFSTFYGLHVCRCLLAPVLFILVLHLMIFELTCKFAPEQKLIMQTYQILFFFVLKHVDFGKYLYFTRTWLFLYILLTKSITLSYYFAAYIRIASVHNSAKNKSYCWWFQCIHVLITSFFW